MKGVKAVKTIRIGTFIYTTNGGHFIRFNKISYLFRQNLLPNTGVHKQCLVKWQGSGIRINPLMMLISQYYDSHHFYEFVFFTFLAMLIYKQFTFDSAHFLPNVPARHKCNNVHGHTYKFTVFVEGDLQKEPGWVMDYADMKKAIMPVIEMIDHQFLNNIAGLENPTAELLVIWLWNKIKPRLPLLKRLELNETSSSGVIYEE